LSFHPPFFAVVLSAVVARQFFVKPDQLIFISPAKLAIERIFIIRAVLATFSWHYLITLYLREELA